MTSQLCVMSEPLRYAADDYELLETDLQTMCDDTHICDMPPLSDLIMLPDGHGKTTGGWTMSSHGLIEISRELCNTLPLVLLNVGGIRSSATTRQGEISENTVLELFNVMLRLRYANLEKKKLVIRRSTRTIDGFSKTTGGYIDNRTVLQGVSSAMRSRNFRFAGAITNNRSMRLWFRENNKGIPIKVSPELTNTHWRGVFVSNYEAASGGALEKRLPRISISEASLWTNGCSFECKNGRAWQAKSGKSGVDLIIYGCDLMLKEMPTVTQLTTQLKMARRTPLNVEDFNDPTVHRAYWINRMTSAGVQNKLAKTFLKRTLSFGAEGKANLVPGTLRTLTPRNTYDLYCIVSSTARNGAPTMRERSERFAHSLLFNKKGK